MLTPRRTYSATNSYRYGFNGKENDNEVKGEGDQQDYGMRIYDPRIGSWFSVDAYADKYPNVSPYSFCINSPLQFTDANGHWLVDKNGNIIYTTDVAAYEIKGNDIYQVSRFYFYTNDGQAVEVRKYFLKSTLDNVEWADKEHKIFKDFKDRGDKLIVIADSGIPELTNCHATTLNLQPGRDLYIAGLDDNGNDNVSKIFKNTAEFTPVKAEDVKPGDVAIFDDGNGNIAHSATVDKVKKHGKKVRLTSKDDRNPVKHNQSIKDIQKTNPAYKRLVGYYRHNSNKQIDAEVNTTDGFPGYAGSNDGEQINKILEDAKKKDVKKKE